MKAGRRFTKSLIIAQAVLVAFTFSGQVNGAEAEVPTPAISTPGPLPPAGQPEERVQPETSSKPAHPERVFWFSMIYGGGILILSLLVLARFIRRS